MIWQLVAVFVTAVIIGLYAGSILFIITDLVDRTLGAIRLRIKVRRCRQELDAVLMDEREQRGIIAREYTERRRRQALDAIARSTR